MAGRKPDPDTPYKVFLHKSHGYRYAATQSNVVKEDGVTVRRYVYWGEVTKDWVFIPNMRYKTATAEEKARLIFPPHWDLSAINGSPTACPLAPLVEAGKYETYLYGTPWLLKGIADKLGVTENLVRTFEDEGIAADVLAAAMFPVITNSNYDQMRHWQQHTWSPAQHLMTPSKITRLSQAIKDHHRMTFLKLRLAAQPEGALVACDSTTRSAWGRCLADIRWGANKDNPTLKNTVEMVVYSLTTHQPIYYRTFAGNENDLRTLKILLADLKALGCAELLVIFDRGYASAENIEDMLRADLPFLMCMKTNQEPVYSCLKQIEWDSTGLPANMDYYAQEHVYCKQFEHAVALSDNAGDGSLRYQLKINVYLDVQQRMAELIAIDHQIKQEQERLSECKAHPELSYPGEGFENVYHHRVKHKDGSCTWELNTAKVDKARTLAGFFSSCSYRMEGGAQEQLDTYALRDEQEKYFEAMKDQLGFCVQRNSSEDGKTGRLFILFIGLILRTHLRFVWSNTLKEDFPSSVDVLNEMAPIRLSVYQDGSHATTAFNDRQVKIATAFGLEIPEMSTSSRQKAELERAVQGPRRRGRPKGSVNKKKAS